MKKAFTHLLPQSMWASLTLAHPLCDPCLAGRQRLHLESVIGVLGRCTEPLKKRKTGEVSVLFPLDDSLVRNKVAGAQ